MNVKTYRATTAPRELSCASDDLLYFIIVMIKESIGGDARVRKHASADGVIYLMLGVRSTGEVPRDYWCLFELHFMDDRAMFV